MKQSKSLYLAVSIIVPVYNVERFLPKCLDSILNQTFQNFELLLIDDGSSDNSGSICDEYAKKDSRIKVFHQENKGVSSARNLGLDYAQGKYILFVDSDDWVASEYLQDFIRIVDSKKETDIILSGFVNVYKDREIKKTFLEKRILCFDALTELLIFRYGYPWGKLYRNDIIKENKLRFDTNLTYGEDLIFLLEYLKKVKNIYFSNGAYYFYNRIASTLSRRYNSYKESRRLLDLTILNVNQLVGSKKLPQKTLKELVKLLLRRTVSSMYRPHCKLPRKDRIVALKELIYTHSILVENFSILLSNDFVLSFDCYYNLIFFLRYSLLKYPWLTVVYLKNKLKQLWR